jgi:hypothetical protein
MGCQRLELGRPGSSPERPTVAPSLPGGATVRPAGWPRSATGSKGSQEGGSRELHDECSPERRTSAQPNERAGRAVMATGYSQLPNQQVSAANGVDYAYRDTGGGEGGVPLVLLQHFRGNLDNWDPALIDALAARGRRVVTFDNAGVGGSTGTTPDTHRADGPRCHRIPQRPGTQPGRPARLLHRQLRRATDRAGAACHCSEARFGVFGAPGRGRHAHQLSPLIV